MSAATKLALSCGFALLSLFGCTPDEPPNQPLNEKPKTARSAAGPQIHEGTGLIMADGWEMVASNCTGCHSARQLRDQRGTRETWQAAIDWMQETQGVPQFPPGIEDRIVAYLAANYGLQGSSGRRARLPAQLMPPNPYGDSSAGK